MNRCGGDAVVLFEACLTEATSSTMPAIAAPTTTIQTGRSVADKEIIVFGAILANLSTMLDVARRYQQGGSRRFL